MLTPAIRAKVLLPLPLLVSWVLADHEHPPVAADDLALLAHRLDRRSYLHDPFRCLIQTEWLWRPVRPPMPCPRSAHRAHGPRRPKTRSSRIPNGRDGPGRRAMRRISSILAALMAWAARRVWPTAGIEGKRKTARGAHSPLPGRM